MGKMGNAEAIQDVANLGRRITAHDSIRASLNRYRLTKVFRYTLA